VTNAGSNARQVSFRCAVRKHNVTALRVLRHGEVVATVGAQDVPYPVHSIRKSIVGALFGRLIERKLVGLGTTLAELGIDDVPQLTPLERFCNSGAPLDVEFRRLSSVELRNLF